jgi:hypothetical protein
MGNMQFSGICPAETAKPIKMKFYTIDYVERLHDVLKIDVIG